MAQSNHKATVSQDEPVNTTIRLDRAVWAALHEHSYLTGESKNQIINAALRKTMGLKKAA